MKMKKAKKCVICNARKGKRFCVKENDFICSRCCGLIRDPQLCPNDCPYIGSLTEKEEASKLPLYKVLMTKPKGSRSIFVTREKEDGYLQLLSVLVDEWKMGLKDCFGSDDVSKEEFDKIVARQPLFVSADLNKCKEIIKRGMLIAETLGLRIPREFEEFKYILGDLDSVEVTGSLYKCFKCGKEDLSDEIVEQIKEVTLDDVAAGVCGTEDETRIYFVCDKCKRKEEMRKMRRARRMRRGRRSRR
jgi:hypothetical protein